MTRRPREVPQPDIQGEVAVAVSKGEKTMIELAQHNLNQQSWDLQKKQAACSSHSMTDNSDIFVGGTPKSMQCSGTSAVGR